MIRVFNKRMAEQISLEERQYRLAIDARDKLNDNYHKWMNFYYVANGAILVAITTLFNKNERDNGIFLLSLMGIFICLLWNFSCKGYYYWSNNWINIIITLEKKVTKDNNDLLVYSAFSKRVIDAETNSWLPLRPANISTPKVTLLFSTFSVIAWTTFSIVEFLMLFSHLSLCCKIIIIVAIITVVLLVFLKLPRFVKSRHENKHTYIE